MNEVETRPARIVGSPTAVTDLWKETGATLKLAIPIMIGQLLQCSLGVIDTIMVGRVNVASVAAASLASSIFVVPLVFGFGVLGPTSVLVARSTARGNVAEGIHHLRRGLLTAATIGVGVAVLITALAPSLSRLDQPGAVVAQATPFLLLLTWSIVPMYLFQVLKQYCEALHAAWPPMAILTAGVGLNAFLNWIFIFGHFRVTPMGLLGAGWATFATRFLMMLVLSGIVYQDHFRKKEAAREFLKGTFDWAGYKNLLRLGLRAGVQVILDVGAFTFAAVMMGWISQAALASHQVAISVASTTFMIPFGLSMAVAVRVSHALGANDPQRACSCIQGSLLMTVGVMCGTAVFIFSFAHQLAAFFIHDATVIALAARVLIVAALFQIFDGTQIVCSGALRGFQDVQFPTVITLFGYWVCALPLSYVLGFRFHLGAVGIWIGLLLGLALVAGLLLFRLKLLVRRSAAC
jgi:MATE family multidrug resistance protein